MARHPIPAGDDATRPPPGRGGVACIVLTLEQRERTLRFLRSLRASDPGPLHILVWDNGSADGTAEAISGAYPDIEAHRHPTNLGVASGRNAAAALAMDLWSPDYLLFLDNDLELEPGFVGALRRVIDSAPDVGQAQAKLRFMHARERLNDGGGCTINFLTGETKPVGYDEVDRGQHDRVKPCISCGGAMMVRARVFQELGGFDSAFDPFGPEDLDFSLRLQKAGYRSLFCPEAVAYHLVSHTFGAGYTEDYARHKARHWLTFLGRHGSVPQKLGFYCLGAPYMALRVAVREGRRGNLGALRGILRGLLERLGGA